jgi:lipopolysaccharide biosynthesis glycosyltransferase
VVPDDPGVTQATIDVLFCADGPYFQHMGATIASLLRANRTRLFRLFICAAERDVSAEEKITIIAERFGNAMTRFIYFDVTQRYGRLRTDRYLTIATYLRLFVTDYLDSQIAKLLYLDCDVIVCDDISVLWETDLGESMVAAVPEPYITRHPGFVEGEPYFSAGVLLLDVRRWRSADVVSHFLTFAQRNESVLMSHDQDILNNVFKGRIKALPYRWNFQASFADLEAAALNLRDVEFRELRRRPAIVHYTGRFKPWWYEHQPHYKSLYWDALQHTPWSAYQPPDRTRRVLLARVLRGTRLRERLNWYAPRLLDSIRGALGRPTRLRIDSSVP